MAEPEVQEYSIFVSHSHHDSEFCLQLVNALYQRIPADIFYDETTIRGGEMWMERISHEVLSRPIFIVVLSARSVEADWVRAETYMALNEAITNRGKRWVIPIRLERCDVKKLAPLLSYRQIIDFAGKPLGPGLDELVDAIQKTSQQPEQLIIETGASRHSSQRDEQEEERRLAANVHTYYRQHAYRHVTVIGIPAIESEDNVSDAELWAEVGHSFLEVARGSQDNNEVNRTVGEARRILEKASKINSKRPDIWRWLAEGCSLSGDIDSAMKYWITALNWSDSPERILEIYADACSALKREGRDADRDGYINAAKEIAEVSSLGEGFEFNLAYWEQLSIHDDDDDDDDDDEPPPPPPNYDREAAFSALQDVVAELGSSGRPRKFPSVVSGLQRRGIHHSKLGYSKFADFMVDAEKRGVVRVVGPAEWGQVYLPTEKVALQPVQSSSPASSPKAPKQLSQSNESVVAVIVSQLEKRQPYITVEGVLEYFKKKHSHLAGTAEDLLRAWMADGDVVKYVTQPLFLDKSGQAQSVSAIRLNPQSARLQRLIQNANATSLSSWTALDSETQEFLISTLKLLTDSLPYLTWNHFRTLLAKQDKDTDWDTSIATAIDCGVIDLRLLNVEDKLSHQLHTITSLSLNNTNSVVAEAAEQAMADPSANSGWQRARQSLAKLFNMG